MAKHKVRAVINDDLRQTSLEKDLKSKESIYTLILGYLAIKCNLIIKNESLIKSDLREVIEGVELAAITFLSGMVLGSIIETNDKLHRLK